jgi:hypothetical protein
MFQLFLSHHQGEHNINQMCRNMLEILLQGLGCLRTAPLVTWGQAGKIWGVINLFIGLKDLVVLPPCSLEPYIEFPRVNKLWVFADKSGGSVTEHFMSVGKASSHCCGNLVCAYMSCMSRLLGACSRLLCWVSVWDARTHGVKTSNQIYFYLLLLSLHLYSLN